MHRSRPGERRPKGAFWFPGLGGPLRDLRNQSRLLPVQTTRRAPDARSVVHTKRRRGVRAMGTGAMVGNGRVARGGTGGTGGRMVGRTGAGAAVEMMTAEGTQGEQCLCLLAVKG